MKNILGVDLGEARCGVAVSDDLGMLAHPLETIDARKQDPMIRLMEIITARSVQTVVVGMPRNMDGSFGPAAEGAKAFIERLREKSGCKVIPWDERLTTVSAQRLLQQAGRKAKDQRSVIDQVAAQVLLQSWLDGQG